MAGDRWELVTTPAGEGLTDVQLRDMVDEHIVGEWLVPSMSLKTANDVVFGLMRALNSPAKSPDNYVQRNAAIVATLAGIFAAPADGLVSIVQGAFENLKDAAKLLNCPPYRVAEVLAERLEELDRLRVAAQVGRGRPVVVADMQEVERRTLRTLTRPPHPQGVPESPQGAIQALMDTANTVAAQAKQLSELGQQLEDALAQQRAKGGRMPPTGG